MDGEEAALLSKTKQRLVALRREVCDRLRRECLALLDDQEFCRLPVILARDALSRQFVGRTIAVVRKDAVCKQKVSLKIGDRALSIGDYDSKEDGDLLEFVSNKYKERRTKKQSK